VVSGFICAYLTVESRWQPVSCVTVLEYGDQMAVFVCDGCVIWKSKCAIEVELRCGRFIWNLLVIVVFESRISLAKKLQLDSQSW